MSSYFSRFSAHIETPVDPRVPFVLPALYGLALAIVIIVSEVLSPSHRLTSRIWMILAEWKSLAVFLFGLISILVVFLGSLRFQFEVLIQESNRLNKFLYLVVSSIVMISLAIFASAAFLTLYTVVTKALSLFL